MDAFSNLPLPLSEEERNFLGHYGFDQVAFLQLQDDLAKGEFSHQRNILQADFRPPAPEDLVPSNDQSDLTKIGEDAINNGEAGIAVLNGGMATRFNGVVKGIVKATNERSFLDLKLSDLMRWSAQVPAFLMNSFATEEATDAHLEENNHFNLAKNRIHQVTQKISLRLTPQGALFKTPENSPSFYAPGHGDLFEVLAASSALRKERDRGLRYLLVSNVDNLAANLSPSILGAHIRHNNPVTVEVAPRNPGDRGGAPVYVNDRLEIVEGFRFPPDFNHESLPVFNTNTFVFNVEVFDSTYPLTWFRADKTVNHQAVVQFERLMGQITHFLDTTYLTVPREGPEGRFMPVKTPDDLERLAPTIRNRFTYSARRPK